MPNSVENNDARRGLPTPICAIGASAGGVGALRTLFSKLPADLGLAYVVIVHLAPDHPSALREILAATTTMPVHQVTDSPTLKPNCVYVIAPDRELVIEGDAIEARAFSQERGSRAPIDLFFRSIAAARGDGLGVVLTGSGSDGAIGVKAIKECGGVIFVQDPAEAEFPSMPQNAIATGVADFIAPIAELAERIAEIAQSKEAVRSLDADGAANDLRRIVSFLHARTGHDFSSYKRTTVMRRVLRRMQVRRMASLGDYATYLKETPEEASDLFRDMLISVTHFFRDGDAFEVLAKQALEPILNELADEGVRVWVAGCATGEEAYSISMLILEELERRKMHVPVQIFAYRPRRRRPGNRARRGLPPGNRGRPVARAAQTFLHRRRVPLPGAPGTARNGAVRLAQRAQGSAVPAARPDQLSQPDDLS
jgi:two-component system, chemotaxis family, CheB/CheR fusion protein